ncbi:monovalent cation/H(+) antiporter subunit G [Alkalinema sp. FACHB-956]|uniref:monovalent cation/H(+) antiporter subunit G n=1 Tax=Alkalinema sp. FACHB-956 TaxID=2692768 RepID=UPI001686E3C6|nr:monovalent cation/H(+) antiporter subunit G [Alkalinema sp. FACHB-956]MBD2327536.1 monovalent cation/H(+) antiporter subunit G [Alkalinema sp. FACHB-956]
MRLLSYACIAMGLIFWFWGTSSLLSRRSLLFKLHNLSVSDTLGSISIIVGLLLLRSREWPLLLLAILSLAFWNTMLGYVLAYCSSSPRLDAHLGRNDD